MTISLSVSPHSRSKSALSIVAATALFVFVACRSEAERKADSTAAANAGKAVSYDVNRYAPSDFAMLRWIEGDWRGQMASGGNFYERYKFADDSTIVMHGFEDSTFTHANDSAMIVIRDGVVTDRGAKAQWSATRLDANGIEFAPGSGATNRFAWNRESSDKWTAEISPAKGKPTLYHMERVRPK